MILQTVGIFPGQNSESRLPNTWSWSLAMKVVEYPQRHSHYGWLHICACHGRHGLGECGETRRRHSGDISGHTLVEGVFKES